MNAGFAVKSFLNLLRPDPLRVIDDRNMAVQQLRETFVEDRQDVAGRMMKPVGLVKSPVAYRTPVGQDFQ